MGISGPLPENLLRCMDAKDRAPLGASGLTAAEAVHKAQRREERKEQGLFALELSRRALPYVWRQTCARSTASIGTPDFIFTLRGVTWWVEFKAPGGKLSPEQVEFGQRLSRQGVQLQVCRSATEAIGLIKKRLASSPAR